MVIFKSCDNVFFYKDNVKLKLLYFTTLEQYQNTCLYLLDFITLATHKLINNDNDNNIIKNILLVFDTVLLCDQWMCECDKQHSIF